MVSHSDSNQYLSDLFNFTAWGPPSRAVWQRMIKEAHTWAKEQTLKDPGVWLAFTDKNSVHCERLDSLQK